MIGQSIKMAWSAIASNKMRAFLTMLGIIIGVTAIVVLVSLVNGATNSVTSTIEDLGTNMLTVSVMDNKGKPLTATDVQAFAEAETIEQTAPYSSMSATAKFGNVSEDATVIGTTRPYADINSMKLESGRFLMSADEENRSMVAVINQDAAKKLYGHTDVVGETFSINGRTFSVIGVLAEDESFMAAFNSGKLMVYIPFSVEASLAGNPYVNNVYLSATDGNDLTPAQNEITSLLKARFSQDEDAFLVQNQSTLLDAIDSVTGTMSLLLGGIAAISLLVGGIGIMNIMLVSVTERTREIGIRKAIGASRGSILMQFLIEALMVSLIGCAIGLGISWFLLQIVTSVAANAGYDSITFAMSAGVVGIAVAFSVAIGVVFGLYPANKASKLHPIVALRNE